MCEGLAGGDAPQWVTALQQGQLLHLSGTAPPFRVSQAEVEGVRTDSE